jgi:integrase
LVVVGVISAGCVRRVYKDPKAQKSRRCCRVLQMTMPDVARRDRRRMVPAKGFEPSTSRLQSGYRSYRGMPLHSAASPNLLLQPQICTLIIPLRIGTFQSGGDTEATCKAKSPRRQKAVHPGVSTVAAIVIGKRNVDAAGAGRWYDAKLPGFGLYVSPDGRTRSYFVEYRPKGLGRAGGKKRLTFARHGGPRPDGSSWTADLARDEALCLLGSIKAGADPLGERAAARTRAETEAADCVGAAIRRWLETDQKDKRHRGEVERMLRKDVLPAWDARPLASVHKRDVIDLIERVHERAPVGANRLLGSLQRFFKWAAARDLIEASPAAAVEKPGRETTRGRVLSDAELVEIWRAAERMGTAYGAGIRLLILTAARRGEIFRARRDELDLAGGRILLPAVRSKNGEPRSIWLPPLTLEIVAALPAFTGSPWLLTAEGQHPCTNHGYNRRRLDALFLEARRTEALKLRADLDGVEPIPRWWVHDLRRTAATGMQRLGVRFNWSDTSSPKF